MKTLISRREKFDRKNERRNEVRGYQSKRNRFIDLGGGGGAKRGLCISGGAGGGLISDQKIEIFSLPFRAERRSASGVGGWRVLGGLGGWKTC